MDIPGPVHRLFDPQNVGLLIGMAIAFLVELAFPNHDLVNLQACIIFVSWVIFFWRS